MKERKYLAISIKHTEYGWKFGKPCVLWGYKQTKDDEKRCFADYTQYPEKAEMLYSFRDDEGAWHSWDYQKMLQHKRGFDESNTWDRYEKASASGNVSLEEIGPLGGGTNWPYEAVAYLSFAYYTKWWYKQVINRIDEWLAESQ